MLEQGCGGSSHFLHGLLDCGQGDVQRLTKRNAVVADYSQVGRDAQMVCPAAGIDAQGDHVVEAENPCNGLSQQVRKILYAVFGAVVSLADQALVIGNGRLLKSILITQQPLPADDILQRAGNAPDSGVSLLEQIADGHPGALPVIQQNGLYIGNVHFPVHDHHGNPAFENFFPEGIFLLRCGAGGTDHHHSPDTPAEQGVQVGQILPWLVAVDHDDGIIALGTGLQQKGLADAGEKKVADIRQQNTHQGPWGGGTVFIMYMFLQDKGSTSSIATKVFPSVTIPGVSSIPVLGQILSGHNVLTYVAFLMVAVVWVLLFRTRLGAHIRAVGENPGAAASVGINVVRTQNIALLLSGFLTSLGGAFMSMGYMNGFSQNMVAGRGFIALAAASMGQLHPVLGMVAALIFGAADAFSNAMAAMRIPDELVKLIPYATTIVGMVVFSAVDQRRRLARKKQAMEQS